MARARKKRARPPSPPTQPKSPPIPSGHRRARTMVALAAVTVAGLGLGWYLWAWSTAPALPAVALADADPVVADAIGAARRALWWNPRSAAAWGRLGQLLRAHRFKAESNLCFAHAERLDPQEPRWPYLQGVSLQLDDPETALGHLQRAVALCGHEPDAPRLSLAEVFLQQGQLAEAEQHFRHVLQRDPDHARAHLGLGRLACERGKLHDGLAHLTRSAASPLTQKAACVLLAQVYHQLGDRPAANRERVRAAELPTDPPWPDPFQEETRALLAGKQARLNRLQTLHRQGRVTEARALARELEKEYPDVYWLVEGRGQLGKGNFAAAERAFRKAVQLAPEAVEAHFDLGTALFKQENYREAAACFQKATELEPGYGPAYHCLGHCRLRLGDRAAALQAFQQALHSMPQHAETHRDLGEVLAQEGRQAEALVHLRQALKLQPEDATARQLLKDITRRAPPGFSERGGKEK